jgi:pyruvyltransferase
MFSNNKIRLFWWNEAIMMKKENENYGDLLGKYLVEKISKKQVVWTLPKKFSFKNYYQPIYVTIGSVLANVTENCVIWGSGVISKEYPIKKAKFLAVRGPQTRNFLLNQGYNVPEIYGDPALLLPDFYFPNSTKKFKYGIVPHYNDYKLMSQLYSGQQDVLVINLMTNNVEEVTDLFLQCEKTISTSLHGIIVSHAYRIPSVWVQFSDKVFGDGIKFQDYFESVKMESYIPTINSNRISSEEIEHLFKVYPSLPNEQVVTKIKEDLMRVCPFK